MTKSKKSEATGYVVWFCEHMRDGREDGAKCFQTLDAAIAFINDARATWFARDNHTFQIFEMGREVKLEQEQVPEHEKVVVKERTVYKVAEKPKSAGTGA